VTDTSDSTGWTKGDCLSCSCGFSGFSTDCELDVDFDEATIEACLLKSAASDAFFSSFSERDAVSSLLLSNCHVRNVICLGLTVLLPFQSRNFLPLGRTFATNHSTGRFIEIARATVNTAISIPF